MKYQLPLPVAVLALTMILGGLPALAQEPDYAVESVAVVRQFVKFELGGGRLTAEGWRSAGNKFFLKPEPESEKKEIHVVSDQVHVMLQTLTANADATVSATFRVCWGKINAQLEFEPTGAHSPPGVEVIAACSEIYKLVLSMQEWNLGPDGKLKPFAGSTNEGTLRAVDFPKYVCLDPAAAIRYVTEMRDISKDPVVKKNAAATLAALKKLRD